MCSKSENRITDEYIVNTFSTSDAKVEDILKRIKSKGGENKNEASVLSKE